MFGSRIPLKTVARLCRTLGSMLNSGVPLLKSLDVVTRKTGDSRCQAALAEVTTQVRAGTDLAAAFRQQGRYFPEIFIDMVDVAEQSGNLPEVLSGMAEHYENLIRLRRSFLSAIAWPVIQLVAAILIIAFLIFILGIIGEMAQGQGQEPIDMLGLGLMGAGGAVIWLLLSFGSVAAIVGSYFLAAKGFRQQRLLDGLLMRIPVVGTCMRSFAIARFSWAFALTQQTGMLISRSLEASLRATGNGAFMAAAPQICGDVLQGEDLGTALDDSRLFPEDYIHLVRVAETSGTVPEALQRLSPQFEEDARRSLRILAEVAGWGVWAMVALLIIYVIFSVMMRYIGIINDLSGGL